MDTPNLSNDELQAILRRIQKLHDKAESCRKIGSLAEAESFAEAVQKTLLKYKLSMSAVDAAALDSTDPVNRSDTVHAFGKSSRRSGWVGSLAGVVAKAHFCRAVHTDGSGIFFYGRANDRQLAEYVFLVLAQNAKREERRAQAAAKREGLDTKLFASAFFGAFVKRLSERYAAERAATPGIGLVLVREEAALQAFRKLAGFARGRGVSYNTSNGAALAAGRAAADRANLRSNGVPAAGGGRLLLGA